MNFVRGLLSIAGFVVEKMVVLLPALVFTGVVGSDLKLDTSIVMHVNLQSTERCCETDCGREAAEKIASFA